MVSPTLTGPEASIAFAFALGAGAEVASFFVVGLAVAFFFAGGGAGGGAARLRSSTIVTSYLVVTLIEASKG